MRFIAKRDKTNSTVESASEQLDLLSRIYTRFLEFLGQGAYIEIVLHSTDFLSGSVKSFKAAVAEGGRMGQLSGALFVFQFLGQVGIAAIAALCCHLSIISNPVLYSDDSSWYIANPWLIVVIAVILSLHVAAAFTTTLDVVSETLIYCWYIAKNLPQLHSGYGGAQSVIPANLDALLNEVKKGPEPAPVNQVWNLNTF